MKMVVILVLTLCTEKFICSLLDYLEGSSLMAIYWHGTSKITSLLKRLLHESSTRSTNYNSPILLMWNIDLTA